jgi:iron complex transport system ATP-binding protein
MPRPDRRSLLAGLGATILLTPKELAALYGVAIETIRGDDGRLAFLPG